MREIATAAEKKAFIQLPGSLWGSDPAWVEPLFFERRAFLDPAQNPFFDHADVALFMAYRDGRPVGRISAQVDRLAPHSDGKRLGMFGLFACESDPLLAAYLFQAAEGWLRTRKVEVVRGPFDLSPNQESGVLVDGFESRPYVMMPHHPKGIAALIEAQGYRKAKDLLAYRMDVRAGLPDRHRRIAETELDGISVRPLDKRRYPEEIRAVASIFNDAWSENWGFVPFTEKEVEHLAKELRPVLDPKLVRIAEKDGEAVAFIVLLPNINEAIEDLGGKLLPFGWAKLLWRLKTNAIRTARVPLMGVRRGVASSLAGKFLPFRLIYALEDRSMQRGFEELELSWLLEDNMSVRRVVESLGGVCAKAYRVYEKALP